jgi:hypothetical protein
MLRFEIMPGSQRWGTPKPGVAVGQLQVQNRLNR